MILIFIYIIYIDILYFKVEGNSINIIYIIYNYCNNIVYMKNIIHFINNIYIQFK